MMRATCLAFSLILPMPAMAEACREEIAALFDGPMDPFQRPPHRQIVEYFDANGTLTNTGRNTVETPLKTIAGFESANHFTLAVDRESWTGPSEQGPWTSTGSLMPENRAAEIARIREDQRANLSDTTCHGANSEGLTHYTFREVSNPDAGGTFFGSLMDIWIDPEIEQVVRFEMREFVNSWSDGVSTDRHVITVEFDPTITVSAPN